jgi:hypothetical protein
MPMTAQEHVNAADIPIVWTVVALDFFTLGFRWARRV